MAIAGQGYAPKLNKLFRTLGMLLHYSNYLQLNSLNQNSFSEPSRSFADPTEKNHFSNLIGIAIADFLSKRIDSSFLTVNYESAMRINGFRIRGRRPDLIAYSANSVFAIESKGRSQNNPGNMEGHKIQSRTGPMQVNFSVACISYNLYDEVKCNYHDPYNDNVPYDNITLQAISRNYYKGLAEFLNDKAFETNQIEIQGEAFYEVYMNYRFFEKLFPNEILSFWRYPPDFLEFYGPKLILPGGIYDFVENGLSNEHAPFVLESTDDDSLYVDYDRVGIRLRS